MDERGFHNNYIFTLVKFLLFLILLCFAVELTRCFYADIQSKDGFKINVFYLSILAPFLFYTFCSDLNQFYGKVQRFFFRSSFFSMLVPSLLVFFSVCFFVLPKVFHFTYSKDIFLFIGGFTFMSHLIFVAREIKGTTFTTFINYLFFFSVLYMMHLILFSLYLEVDFNVHLGKIIFNGMQNGARLIQQLFVQVFR